jgi:uncharacterized protein (TIGR03067 family)
MTYRVLWIAAVLAATGCGKAKPTAADPGPPPGPVAAGSESAELAALKGTWRVVSITAAGQKVPDDRVQKLQLDWVFDENGLAIRRPDRPAEPPGRLTFDATTNPKRYTKMSDIAPSRAVYRLDGKTLTVCLMVDENQSIGFPAGLVSTASPKTDLLILERR